jgi:hypothetical protein
MMIPLKIRLGLTADELLIRFANIEIETPTKFRFASESDFVLTHNNRLETVLRNLQLRENF